MNYKSLSTALILSVVAVTIASAGEIYKWTDDDGNVHYTDKPIDARSEHMDIQSRPTNETVVNAEIQTRVDYQERRAESVAAAAEEQKSADELRAEAEERQEKCSMYRARLTKFVQSRRLYREDEDGERVYLDEEQTQTARDDVENKVDEYCNS